MVPGHGADVLEPLDAVGTTADGTYAALRDEIMLRIALQSKSVEMSRLLLTGMGALLLGSQFLERPVDIMAIGASHPGTMVLTLWLHWFLQAVIVANYVYQTWLIRSIDKFIRQATQDDSSSDHTPGIELRPGSWEHNMSRFTHYGGLAKLGSFVELFQPLVAYASLGIGLAALVAAVGVWGPRLPGAWGPILAWAVALGAVLSSLALMGIHLRVTKALR